MHESIRENLERILGASRDWALPSEVEQHLEACEPCRRQVEAMRRQSTVLRSLRAPADAAPSAGFYARVVARLEAQESNSIWNIFLDPFGKRLAYAAATLLLLLGTYIYTSESSEVAALAPPEAVLAVHDTSHSQFHAQFDVDQQQERDALLVNLATYEEGSYQ